MSKRKRMHEEEWRMKQGEGAAWDDAERQREADKWAEAVRKRQRGEHNSVVSHDAERAGATHPDLLPGNQGKGKGKGYTPLQSHSLVGSRRSLPLPSTTRLPGSAIAPQRTLIKPRQPARQLTLPKPAPPKLTTPKPGSSRQLPSKEDKQYAMDTVSRLGTLGLSGKPKEELIQLGQFLMLPATELQRTREFIIQKLVRTAYNLNNAQKHAPQPAASKPATKTAAKIAPTKPSAPPVAPEKAKRWVRCPLCQSAVSVDLEPGAYSCVDCQGLFRC